MIKVAITAECIREKMDGQAWFTYHLARNLAKMEGIDLTLIGSDYLNKIDISAEKLVFKEKKNLPQKIFCMDTLKKINYIKKDVFKNRTLVEKHFDRNKNMKKIEEIYKHLISV